MITRKMEAKSKNEEKFRDVLKVQLERELDQYEEEAVRAKIDHERKLKILNDEALILDTRKEADTSRRDLNQHKLQFMKDLYKFDPRWKDKVRAKKQMELQRLENKRTQIQTEVQNLMDEQDRELNHQIKNAKFDIYKLQKHADIKRNLMYSSTDPAKVDMHLLYQIHEKNKTLQDHEENEYLENRDSDAKIEEDKQAEIDRKEQEERAKEKVAKVYLTELHNSLTLILNLTILLFQLQIQLNTIGTQREVAKGKTRESAKRTGGARG